MMKKYLLASAFVVSAGLVSSNALAYYLDVEGFAAPYVGGVTDNGDGTSTLGKIDYVFKVITADSTALQALQLVFESDVFVDFGSVGAVDPNDWSVVTAGPQSDGAILQIAVFISG